MQLGAGSPTPESDPDRALGHTRIGMPGRRRGRLKLVAIVLTLISVAAALSAVPVLTKRFSGAAGEYDCAIANYTGPIYGCPAYAGGATFALSFPSGSSVNLRWQSVAAGPLQIEMWPPGEPANSTQIGVGTSGSWSFHSQGGTDYFTVQPAVPQSNVTGEFLYAANFTGTYTAPLL